MLNRRKFFGGVASLAGLGVMAGPLLRRGLATATPEPHFLMSLYFSGGVDNTYLFDARDPALRAAGLSHSYMPEPPTIWEGTNGGRTLATAAVKSLEPVKDYFSVLTGVVMSTTNDGHEQNRNKLFTNSTSGGASYMTAVGELGGTPLDLVELGFEHAQVTGGTRVRAQVQNLEVLMGAASASLEGSSIDEFIASRARALSQGVGTRSAGARAMTSGIYDSRVIAERLAGIKRTTETDLLAQSVYYACELFKTGLCRTLALSNTLPIFFDTHDMTTAQAQPANMTLLAEQVRRLIDLLSATPYDENTSMADVTTFVVSSEFSRTNKQFGVAIDQTGTDHNALTNTVLVGGKGIRGGQVIGASDLSVLAPSGNAFADVAPLHATIDPFLLKPLGRPFDFETMRPLAADVDAPRLHIESVLNTLMAAFGVDPAQHFVIDRDEKAPVLTGLLA